MSSPGVTISLWSPICIMSSFSLCQGSSECFCVCFMIHNAFYESTLNSFLALGLHYSFTHTRTWASSTELIHSKQTPPIDTQPSKCIMSLSKENHRHFRTKGSRSDPAFWQSISSSGGLSCDPLSGPIPDYLSPAAGAAEWLHYVSEVPGERGDGERAVWSLPVTSVRVSAAWQSL